MVTGVLGNRRGEQPVIGNHLFQGGDPVVVVLPIAPLRLGRVLPPADRLDEAVLEVIPFVVAEFRQRQGQAERAALPLVVESGRRLIGGARFVESHDAGPARATPSIDSVVTKSISSSAVKSSVPEGRSGITNHRWVPLLSRP
jgi:hypothetical protein